MLASKLGKQIGLKHNCRTTVVATVVVALGILATIVSLPGQTASIGDKFYVGGRTHENDVGAVVMHHLATGEVREFYKPSDGFVFDFKPSPSGELLAITTQVLKFDVMPHEATVLARGRAILERKTLHILSSTGREIDAIPQVRSYAWSPQGTELAYVIGEYRGIYDNYANTSAWIWNSANKERRRISENGYEVSWARFDNNIYLWSIADGIAGKAVKYSVSMGRHGPTTHWSIYFSPSGDYYFHPGGGTGLPENVYVRSTDVGLRETSRVLLNLSGWRPISWAPDADLLLMHVSKKTGLGAKDDAATIVYNPADDSSADLGAADVLGWGGSAAEIVVRNGTRVEKKRVVDLQLPANR
jgi:hypothetical protein